MTLTAQASSPIVLLVEDDVDMMCFLRGGLEKAGYRCLSAASPADALGLVESGQRFDAAVVDAGMGAGGGINLGVRLKRRVAGSNGFLPVLLLAERDCVEERIMSLTAGCDDFLAKPVSTLELDARLGVLLARRAQYATLACATEQLREAQKKKRELAALMVHDLRNPLTALRGNLDLFRQEVGSLSESAETILSDLEELAEKALALAAGILDVEELEEGILTVAPELCEVEPIARAISRHQRAAVRVRELTIEFDLERGLRARFDPTLVSRILENLLDNAVRYAPIGGRVVVSAHLVTGKLVLSVGNDGPPVPAGERGRLFDRYYRVEERREGARAGRGLGLYFCKLAAEAHGGTIAVGEEPGLPACFAVRIPQPD
jgi:signal transduction histidine kinase